MTISLRNALLASVGLLAPMALPMPAQATAPSDILFILDGSGSMWGQVNGVAKIRTAKETLGKLLDTVPANARLGLITYGDRDEKSCTDVSYVNPLGAAGTLSRRRSSSCARWARRRSTSPWTSA